MGCRDGDAVTRTRRPDAGLGHNNDSCSSLSCLPSSRQPHSLSHPLPSRPPSPPFPPQNHSPHPVLNTLTIFTSSSPGSLDPPFFRHRQPFLLFVAISITIITASCHSSVCRSSFSPHPLPLTSARSQVRLISKQIRVHESVTDRLPVSEQS